MTTTDRQAHLRSFGFTPDDIRRIQTLAEAATYYSQPAALDDLSVPIRVGACVPERAGYHNGKVLGEWAGRVLLYWPIQEGSERRAWEARRKG